MTEQELEGNKLIAEFMGLIFNGHHWELPQLHGRNKIYEELKYHSSWDWLMAVAEKIEQTGCIIEIWLSLGKGCRITKVTSKIKSWQTVMESNSTIEAVWLAVIEFIKWYNQNKKTMTNLAIPIKHEQGLIFVPAKEEKGEIVIDDSIKVKVGDWYVTKCNEIYQSKINGNDENGFHFCRKIIAQYNLNLPNIPKIEIPSEDVEKLAVEWFSNYYPNNGGEELFRMRALKSFTEGYKAAQEKYKFSEEDMIKMAYKNPDQIRNYINLFKPKEKEIHHIEYTVVDGKFNLIKIHYK